MEKYAVYRALIMIGTPIIIAFVLIDFIVPIAFITSVAVLMILFIDEDITDRLLNSLIVYLFFFALFLMLLDIQVFNTLQITSAAVVPITPLSLDQPLQRLFAMETTNSLIAFICITGSVIFWILGMITGRGRKVILALGFIVASIYFLETFYIFISPESAAQNVGWYRATIEWFEQTHSFGALNFLLNPLRTLAILEYYFVVSATLTPAIAVCFGLYFINDIIAAKFGVDVEAIVRRESQG